MIIDPFLGGVHTFRFNLLIIELILHVDGISEVSFHLLPVIWIKLHITRSSPRLSFKVIYYYVNQMTNTSIHYDDFGIIPSFV